MKKSMDIQVPGPSNDSADPAVALGACGLHQTGRGWQIFESRQPAGLEVHGHGHGHARLSLCLVLHGSFEDDAGGCFDAGQLLLTPGGDEPSLLFGPSGAHCLLIEVDDRLWSESGAGVPVPEMMRVEEDAAVLGLLVRLRVELGASGTDFNSLEPALFELLVELARRRGAGRDAVAGSALGLALEAIHDGYRGRLTLSRVAGHAGVHRMTLARGFRAAFGLSVGEYLHHLRVADACRLIEVGLPLAEVAAETGFSDQSHLNRIFRRLVGRTPGGFRRLSV